MKRSKQMSNDGDSSSSSSDHSSDDDKPPKKTKYDGKLFLSNSFINVNI
jgi:hypothetical protein